MPCDPSNYPADWPQIRERILARAGHQCECTGECGTGHPLRPERCVAAHGEIGKMGADGVWRTEEEIAALNGDVGRLIYGNYPVMHKQVVTIAHLDHDTRHNEDGNLRAFCQACHLRYDRAQHAISARAARQRKELERQPVLFPIA